MLGVILDGFLLASIRRQARRPLTSENKIEDCLLAGLTRMTTSLLKDTARLFLRVDADIDFYDCMRFSNFQIFKFACIFGISKFSMNLMDRFSVTRRASERAQSRITFVWRICMVAENGVCLPRCPSAVSSALSWT